MIKIIMIFLKHVVFSYLLKGGWVFLYLVLSGLFSSISLTAQAQQKKPNIIIILVDDMGFSDIGSFGGEIPTPNIDILAKNGIRLNNFYNAARCCPTRASLLTGLYPHQAGMGYMATDRYKDIPAYQGYLNSSCVTLGEAMKMNGYFTIMTGKWHVGQKDDGGVTPWSRGFDRSFNTIAGNFYYDDAIARLYLNGRRVNNKEELPANWYTTDLWVDYGVKFIDEAKKTGKPFIWYLAHNAPHYPLQAPEAEIEKFRGKFMKGWEVLRTERYQRQVNMGVIDSAMPLPPMNPFIPKWETLSLAEKKKQDDLMAVYAAVVSRIDISVGNLIKELKKRGEYENTIIMFMSDNGGNAEGGIEGRYFGENPGAVHSHLSVSQGWAELNNTPFWLYKQSTSEGGIATPFIFSWPYGIADSLKGNILPTRGHIMDMMPTCLEIANGTYPAGFKGEEILPMEGVSLFPIVLNQPVPRHKPIFWEHQGNKAMIKDEWKIVSNTREPWQLYNLKTDRTEVKDLAVEYPEQLRKMVYEYNNWFERVEAMPYGYPPKDWQIMQGEKPLVIPKMGEKKVRSIKLN